MDLEYLIDRLEELLDRSTRIPATSRVILNEDEYLRLIDQMRISVPQEIRTARQIEAERDAVLADAQQQAEAMIAAAREKALTLVADHAIVGQAEQRSDEILKQAYDEAQAIRADADAYALEVLERIAVQLDGFRQTVDNGMRMLRPSTAPQQSSTEAEVEPQIVGGSAPAKPRDHEGSR